MNNSAKPSLAQERHYGRDYKSAFSEPLRYYPLAIYTFGVKYRSQADSETTPPHRTICIKEDCRHRAKSQAQGLLNPNAIEFVVLVKCEPNPEHVAYKERLSRFALQKMESN